MIAPIPSAVSATGPSVFLRRVSGFSESEISLSMDFLAKSWRVEMLAAPGSGFLVFSPGPNVTGAEAEHLMRTAGC